MSAFWDWWDVHRRELDDLTTVEACEVGFNAAMNIERLDVLISDEGDKRNFESFERIKKI